MIEVVATAASGRIESRLESSAVGEVCLIDPFSLLDLQGPPESRVEGLLEDLQNAIVSRLPRDVLRPGLENLELGLRLLHEPLAVDKLMFTGLEGQLDLRGSIPVYGHDVLHPPGLRGVRDFQDQLDRLGQ